MQYVTYFQTNEGRSYLQKKKQIFLLDPMNMKISSNFI